MAENWLRMGKDKGFKKISKWTPTQARITKGFVTKEKNWKFDFELQLSYPAYSTKQPIS